MELLDVLVVDRVVLGKDLDVCRDAIARKMNETLSKKPHFPPDQSTLSPLPSALRHKNRGSKCQSQNAQ